MPRPAALTFRLHPEPGDKRWYRVYVFPTAAAMHAYWDGRHTRTRLEFAPGRDDADDHDWAARTTGWETVVLKRGVETPTHNVGEILFTEEHLGAGVVAHEMAHAALSWLDRLDVGPDALADADVEERFAGVVGHLTRHFWRHYVRLAPP